MLHLRADDGGRFHHHVGVSDNATSPCAHPVAVAHRILGHETRGVWVIPGLMHQLVRLGVNAGKAPPEDGEPQHSLLVHHHLLHLLTRVVSNAQPLQHLALGRQLHHVAHHAQPHAAVGHGAQAVHLSCTHTLIGDSTHSPCLIIYIVCACASAKPDGAVSSLGHTGHLIVLHHAHASALTSIRHHLIAIVAAQSTSCSAVPHEPAAVLHDCVDIRSRQKRLVGQLSVNSVLRPPLEAHGQTCRNHSESHSCPSSHPHQRRSSRRPRSLFSTSSEVLQYFHESTPVLPKKY